MGLISHIVLFFTDITDFFGFCRDFFGSLPFSLRMFIYFIFGSVLVFGLMKLIIKVGE